MNVIVQKITAFFDPRGTVWEPLASEELPNQGNCHIVITEPGAIRGNHFHKIGTEIATQTGPARVTYRDQSGTHTVDIANEEIMRFLIPPLCPHAFQNTGSKPNLLVAFNTHPFDPDKPDAYPEELL